LRSVERWDAVIVGGGIAGSSLAWHLYRAGLRVALLERSARPEGASVRNFGMVWVVGQPNREIEALAARSRSLWSQASREFGFWWKVPGSLHLAYSGLEMQVLTEYLDSQGEEEGRRLLHPQDIVGLCPNVRGENLVGGLFSPTEGAVDPRQAAHAMLSGLPSLGVTVRAESPVVRVRPGRVELADGSVLECKSAIVCAGAALHDLLPEAQAAAGLEECRLQMLRLKPRTGTPPLNIHLCAGLTLGHYRNFRTCPSLPALLQQHEVRWPSQVRHGIHVLVSEQPDGSITVGDSHDYGRSGPAYLEEEIDELILEAMDEFLPRELYRVTQRWQGAYLTHPDLPYWQQELDTGVWALSLFGTGMTLSFGVTERLAQEIIKTS
jgi:D-hydroxyproline dehydrogenase subunit beta